MQPKDKIKLFQIAPNAVCARPRLHLPGRYLTASGKFEVRSRKKLDADGFREMFSWADLVVAQRLPFSPTFAKMAEHLNRTGRLLIYEIDDDLLNLHQDNDYNRGVKSDYSASIRSAIQHCQAVQCSTEALAETLREIHPEVVVLENQLSEVPPFRERPVGPDQIIIGYAAGKHHRSDWLMIKDAFNQVLQEIGPETNLQVNIIGDRQIYDSLVTDNKQFLPLMSYENYLLTLQTWNISLIPLAATPFNRAKSDIKFLESAACGCAVLASHPVYGQIIRHEETGIIFYDVASFQHSLKKLISNHQLQNHLAQNARQYVLQNRRMCQHVRHWQETYESWFRRRGELLAPGNACVH